MIDEFMNSGFMSKDSKSSKALRVGIAVGDALLGVIRGFADWIGMGDKIGAMLDDATKVDFNVIKNQLTNRVNKLIAKDEIDLQELTDKLSEMSSMGFSLTGLARDKLSKEVNNQKRKIKDMNIEQYKKKIDYDTIQRDIDKLKNFEDGGTIKSLAESKDIVNKVEKALGEYNG